MQFVGLGGVWCRSLLGGVVEFVGLDSGGVHFADPRERWCSSLVRGKCRAGSGFSPDPYINDLLRQWF